MAARQTEIRPRARELDDLSLARAKRGDQEACRRLLLAYQRPVFALLSRALGRRAVPARVEELAQETFLRVFRGLGEFRSGGSARLSTWILTIAGRLAIDELRRRPLPFEPMEAAAAVRDPAQAVDELVAGRAAYAALARALADLPEDFRVALVLREFHGLGHEEIAAAVGCEVGTVKSRLSRARQRLRQELASEVRDG